jgi:hypothetical protein
MLVWSPSSSMLLSSCKQLVQSQAVPCKRRPECRKHSSLLVMLATATHPKRAAGKRAPDNIRQ